MSDLSELSELADWQSLQISILKKEKINKHLGENEVLKLKLNLAKENISPCCTAQLFKLVGIVGLVGLVGVGRLAMLASLEAKKKD